MEKSAECYAENKNYASIFKLFFKIKLECIHIFLITWINYNLQLCKKNQQILCNF